MTKSFTCRLSKGEPNWVPLYIVILLTLSILWACVSNSQLNETQIILDVSSLEAATLGGTINLVELHKNGGTVRDTFSIVNSGKYASSLTVSRKGLYRAGLPDGTGIYLILDTVPSRLEISRKAESWQVVNSYESARLQKVFDLVREGQNAWNDVMKIYAIGVANGNSDETAIDSVERIYRQKLVDFIISDTHALSSLYALHYLPKKEDEYRKLANSLVEIQRELYGDYYLIEEISREFDLAGGTVAN